MSSVSGRHHTAITDGVAVAMVLAASVDVVIVGDVLSDVFPPVTWLI